MPIIFDFTMLLQPALLTQQAKNANQSASSFVARIVVRKCESLTMVAFCFIHRIVCSAMVRRSCSRSLFVFAVSSIINCASISVHLCEGVFPAYDILSVLALRTYHSSTILFECLELLAATKAHEPLFLHLFFHAMTTNVLLPNLIFVTVTFPSRSNDLMIARHVAYLICIFSWDKYCKAVCVACVCDLRYCSTRTFVAGS